MTHILDTFSSDQHLRQHSSAQQKNILDFHFGNKSMNWTIPHWREKSTTQIRLFQFEENYGIDWVRTKGLSFRILLEGGDIGEEGGRVSHLCRCCGCSICPVPGTFSSPLRHCARSRTSVT